ncbi:MAG: type II secretion system GspH family protein [Candidatus Nomurabacteria bacterium]|jgi:prepilin-type N-terminal cleavage/methylation domain-containing protein|nr:type II secretion system GspH family protein [Candidatus Nomurabacteria bacterium]
MKTRRNQHGDTLIEVILAVAVLSLATVLTMTLVNHSHRNLLSAINRESVRSQINSQAEILHYFHDMGVRSDAADDDKEKWNIIKGMAGDHAEQDWKCSYGEKPFYFDIDSLTDEDNWMAVQGGGDEWLPEPRNEGGWIAELGRGIWINAMSSSNGGSIPYIDFYIKACWTAAAGGREEETSTLVRVNEYE